MFYIPLKYKPEAIEKGYIKQGKDFHYYGEERSNLKWLHEQDTDWYWISNLQKIIWI